MTQKENWVDYKAIGQENGLTFHDIRRSVKTNMLKAGVNKIYRDLILGHSLKGMDVYTVWFDDQLEAVEQAKEKECKVKSS